MKNKYWLVTEETQTSVYPNPSELEHHEFPLESKSELKSTKHESLEEAREAYCQASVSAGEEGNSLCGTIIQEYIDSDGCSCFNVLSPGENIEKSKTDYYLLSRFLEERLRRFKDGIDLDPEETGEPTICNNCGAEVAEMGDRASDSNFYLETNVNDVVSTTWTFCDEECFKEFILDKLQ